MVGEETVMENGWRNEGIFAIFLNFQKKHCAVPLWPIWTIMAAAKLDQSRVLVTKFRQNRSTLKGRSAGQETHRQTDRGKLQNVSPPSVLFERIQIFFTIHRRHRRKKMMDQNFEIRIL